MENNSILFEIKRKAGILTSVKVIMPTWHTLEDDGLLYAKLPFLGIETYGNSEDDLEVAIKEAVIGFCVICEKYGRGLEPELASLGWKVMEEAKGNMGNIVLHADLASGNNEVLEAILETGEPTFLNIEMDSYLQAA